MAPKNNKGRYGMVSEDDFFPREWCARLLSSRDSASIFDQTLLILSRIDACRDAENNIRRTENQALSATALLNLGGSEEVRPSLALFQLETAAASSFEEQKSRSTLEEISDAVHWQRT